MTEKMFYCIETELSGTHNRSFRSVIKELMASCDTPRPQEVPLLVNSHETTQPPFLGRNLGERIYWRVLHFQFDMSLCVLWSYGLRTCILVPYELRVSWLCFIVLLCYAMMFYCVISTCVFLVFSPSRHQTVTQWKWPLFSFCSSPQSSVGRWVIFSGNWDQQLCPQIILHFRH